MLILFKALDIHMKKLKHLILSSILIASPAIAGKLMVAETLKVLEINGVEHSGSFLAKSSEFDISPGEQKLLLKYQEFFEDDDENFATIRSKPFLFSFTAQDNQNYKLKTPALDGESAGKEFAKKPSVILTDSQAEVVVAKVNLLTAASVTAPSPKPMPVAEPVSVQAPAPITNVVSKTRPAPANASSKKQNSADPRALSMLTYWWEQASPEQKQAFLSSINK